MLMLRKFVPVCQMTLLTLGPVFSIAVAEENLLAPDQPDKVNTESDCISKTNMYYQSIF